jgi:unsaturated rhamnogalacturonyl hydrolase
MKAYVDHFVDAEGVVRTAGPRRVQHRLHQLREAPVPAPRRDRRPALTAARSRSCGASSSGQPRTTNGVFWHKLKYPWQVWLDGLYMARAVLRRVRPPLRPALGARRRRPPVPREPCEAPATRRPASSSTVGREPRPALVGTRAPAAPPASGRGRSAGTRWRSRTCTSSSPADHLGAGPILARYARRAEPRPCCCWCGTRAQRDLVAWCPTPRAGREGNYLEASGSAMIAYAWAKVRRASGMIEPRQPARARPGELRPAPPRQGARRLGTRRTGRMTLRNILPQRRPRRATRNLRRQPTRTNVSTPIEANVRPRRFRTRSCSPARRFE